MNNEKNYPEWGMFGEEEKPSEPESQEPESTRGSLQPPSVEYAIEVTLDGTKRHIANLNTPEDRRMAALAAMVDVAVLKLASPQGSIYKLHRARRKHIISAIEIARAMAINPNEAQDVWAALCDLAEAPNRPSVLLGLTDDRSAVRCKVNPTDADKQPAGQFTVKDVREALKHSMKKED
jgi:hypothetical protein